MAQDFWGWLGSLFGGGRSNKPGGGSKSTGSSKASSKTSSRPPQSAPTAPPLSPRRTPSGIPYLTGGLDPEERARLEASQSQFNLRLNFTINNAGDRPFRIQVEIQDLTRQTTLVETEANGPLFMAQLAPGRYLVTLTYSGQEVQRDMSVPGYGAASASFQWTH